MKHQLKLINRLSRAITCFLFLALLPIGVGLGSNPAEAQPFAYITNFGDGFNPGTVSVINTANNTVTDTVTVGIGIGPNGVAAHPAVSFVYVTNLFGDGIVLGDGTLPGTVSVINTSTLAVTSVTVGSMPIGVAVHPSGSFVYVANLLGDGIVLGDGTLPGTVSVIDTVSNTVIDTVTVGIGPTGVAVHGSFVYVTNFGDGINPGTVSVIDTTTNPNTVIDTVTVGIGPTGVAVHPLGSFVYVTNLFGDGIVLGDGTLPGTVSVINTATIPNTVIDTVTVGAGPVGVAVHPGGSFVYVTNQSSNTVSVISTVTNAVTDTVLVGSGPTGVSVNPAGSFVYVANRDNVPGTVSVINTASNTVTATVSVGDAPVAFGQFIGPGAVTTTLPFATMTAKAEIELGPLANDDEFEVKATFTLGAGDGIDPLTEDVSLQVGSYSTTIPAGSFKLHPEKSGKKGKHVKPNKWTFEGVIDGVKIEAKITDLGGGSFEFKAEGEATELTGIANPVTVSLTIGDDDGSTTVTAEFD